MPKINLNLVPEADMTVMANCLIHSIQEYFKNPEHQKAFEEWQKREEQKCIKTP